MGPAVAIRMSLSCAESAARSFVPTGILFMLSTYVMTSSEILLIGQTGRFILRHPVADECEEVEQIPTVPRRIEDRSRM
jgi:hypothetical protein